MKTDDTFRKRLPVELVTHVTAIAGEHGVQWLDRLPFLVDELRRQWSIEVGDPFPAGEFNFVAPALRHGVERVVVKICPPFPDEDILSESEWLRSRNGNGAVRLLAEDSELQTILIERADPGQNLAERFADDELSALAPAIDVLQRILGPPPVEIWRARRLDEWFQVLEKAAGTAFPGKYSAKALDIYHRLSIQPGRTFFLHGDYHPGNVVTATRSPYLAIDPKGVVGHVGYDIAVFLNNFHWWQETKTDMRDRLNFAVAQFAQAFRIDEFELREWAFAQMVLSAWWSFEEMPQFYDNAVAKADIWNV